MKRLSRGVGFQSCQGRGVTRILPHLLFAFLVFTLAACGKSGVNDTGKPEENLQQYELHEIASLYKLYQEDKGRPPAKLADLEAYEAGYSNAFDALRRGRCLTVWGVNMNAPNASETLLAYQKQAPTQGGYVVMADETIKKLTSEEFKALRKPP